MKLLLDECLPEELKDLILDHEVFFTIREMGWKGITNGELMKLAAESGFNVFLTVDKKLPYQQNIIKYQIAIVIFEVFRNTIPDLKKKIPQLKVLLPTVEKANFYLC